MANNGRQQSVRSLWALKVVGAKLHAIPKNKINII